MSLEIELQDVTKTYEPGPTVVKSLSLRLEAGSTLCIIGTSGCGKTTTLKLINRLIEPTSGSIRIGGRDVLSQDVIELRRSIGYVIQEGGLFPHMTIAENVGTVARLEGWQASRISQRVDELLGLVNLEPWEYRDRYPAQLSGGQRQRVGVARALMCDPPIILMDEPFGALDPITRNSLQDEFVRLKADLGKTIVFVTHDLGEAFKLGDQIALMDAGELLQMGTPTELLEEPASPFVADFMRTHAHHKPPHEMIVDDVMVSDTVTVRIDGDLVPGPEDLMRRLDKFRLRSAVVLDERRKVAGVLSRQSLERQDIRDWGELVDASPAAVRSTAALADVLDQMLRTGQTEVPVVDADGLLLGTVTRKSLVECFEPPLTASGSLPAARGI